MRALTADGRSAEIALEPPPTAEGEEASAAPPPAIVALPALAVATGRVIEADSRRAVGGALVWTEKAAGAHYQRVEFAVPKELAGRPWRLRFDSPRPSDVFESNFYFGETVSVVPTAEQTAPR